MTSLFRILITACFLLFSGLTLAKETVRVGVLQYGTVNWEMQAIRNTGLQNNYDIQVEVVPLASTQALLVALQGGKVDVILNDWLWVARQKALSRDYRFAPWSTNGGQLVVRNDRNIHTLKDLKGKTLGIAGGKTNKNWVLYKAYIQQAAGLELGKDIQVKFAAPPMLNALVQQGELDGVINFWHFAAQLNAQGMHTLLTMQTLLNNSGIKAPVPLLGWVFSAAWASQHSKAINDFLAMSAEIRQRMQTDDSLWATLPALTKYPAPAQPWLMDGFRTGAMTTTSPETQASLNAVFETLSRNQEENDVTGPLDTLPAGILWQRH